MSIIMALIFALAIGSQAPAEAPSQAVVQASSDLTTEDTTDPACEEDEACWDCDTLGNKQCSNPELEDAWLSFDSIDLEPAPEGMTIAYVKTLDRMPTACPSGMFAIASTTKANTFYVFQYQTLYTA